MTEAEFEEENAVTEKATSSKIRAPGTRAEHARQRPPAAAAPCPCVSRPWSSLGRLLAVAWLRGHGGEVLGRHISRFKSGLSL